MLNSAISYDMIRNHLQNYLSNKKEIIKKTHQINKNYNSYLNVEFLTFLLKPNWYFYMSHIKTKLPKNLSY